MELLPSRQSFHTAAATTTTTFTAATISSPPHHTLFSHDCRRMWQTSVHYVFFALAGVQQCPPLHPFLATWRNEREFWAIFQQDHAFHTDVLQCTLCTHQPHTLGMFNTFLPFILRLIHPAG